jgi:serine/threonine protein phosphatase PrpC
VTISAFGLTDVGKKRRHNEDAYLLDVERGLFVVADGMGGHAAGEVASRITVESIQEFIAGTEEEHENTWPFGFNNRYSLEGNRLTTAVEKANEKVMRAVQNRPELKGMGTTVVAALFDEDRVTLVHVGDSRAYLFRGHELKRLTDDHSWVQEQVNAGILSEDEAKSHPLKNVVTRALGGAAHVAVDLIEVPLTTGDRFLLCSDGLTGMVSDEEIVKHLGSDDPPDRAVRSLVELANERGGIDNITAILVEVAKHVSDRRPTDPVGVPSTFSTDSTVTVSPFSQITTETLPAAPVEAKEPKEPKEPKVEQKGEKKAADAPGEKTNEPKKDEQKSADASLAEPKKENATPAPNGSPMPDPKDAAVPPTTVEAGHSSDPPSGSAGKKRSAVSDRSAGERSSS